LACAVQRGTGDEDGKCLAVMEALGFRLSAGENGEK
jgi:hypothetical protein